MKIQKLSKMGCCNPRLQSKTWHQTKLASAHDYTVFFGPIGLAIAAASNFLNDFGTYFGTYFGTDFGTDLGQITRYFLAPLGYP